MDDRVRTGYIYYEDMGNEMRPSREGKSKIVPIRQFFFGWGGNSKRFVPRSSEREIRSRVGQEIQNESSPR